MLKGDFGGLERRSHNFLLVCRHWFEVASSTPELWSFWGNTIRDWVRRYPRSGVAPLDLVLRGTTDDDDYFDATPSEVLQDRASRDGIRTIHLRSADPDLLNYIICSLTSEREGIQPNSTESIILQNQSGFPPEVRVSDFFARYRFPKLRRLELTSCTISSWDHLKSRTSILTNLTLMPDSSSSTPTTSQLLSILASNPTLRKIHLSRSAVPNDGGDSSFQVPLHHLKDLRLSGNPQHVVRLLHRLDHPRMDTLHLSLDYNAMDISQTIGPYLGDYIRRRGKSQGGLGLSLSKIHPLKFRVGDVDGIDDPVTPPPINWFLKIDIPLSHFRDALGEVSSNLIAHVPWEELVDFRSEGNLIAMGNVYARFKNLRALSFNGISLAAVFPKSGRNKKIPLSLQRISLDRLSLDDRDWNPLVAFLSYRASAGNRLHTLKISTSSRADPETVKGIRAVVRKFSFSGS